MIISNIIVIALSVTSINAFAVDCSKPPGGIDLESAQVNWQCAEKERSENDAKLNSTYKKLLNSLKNDPETDNYSKTQIVSAQRAWVAFRDAECDFRTSLNGGAHQWLIVNHTQCLSQLTTERVEVLESYIRQANEN